MNPFFGGHFPLAQTLKRSLHHIKFKQISRTPKMQSIKEEIQCGAETQNIGKRELGSESENTRGWKK